MMVLLSHYASHWMSNLAWVGFASTGVDLFFVLSGYVFAPYILSHKPLTWTSHLVRRFFRLYPLYLTALLVYALQRGGMSETWVEFTRHLVMAHTLGGLDTAFYFNPAFWSLPPEVEFYLFMPLVIWLVKRFGAWPVFVAAALARLALVAPGTSGVIEITARAISTVHLPGLLVEFMVGVLVFQQSQHSARPVGRGLVPSRRLPWLACVGLAAALGLYGWAIAPGPAHTATLPAVITGNTGMVAALAYGLVVAAVLTWRLENIPPFMKHCANQLGQLSYGIYLFHNAAPALVIRLMPELANAGVRLSLASLCCTVLVAWAANRLIERPARQWGRSLAGRSEGAALQK